MEDYRLIVINQANIPTLQEKMNQAALDGYFLFETVQPTEATPGVFVFERITDTPQESAPAASGAPQPDDIPF